jgi:hypothetical protein
MAVPKVTEAEVDALLSSGSLSISRIGRWDVSADKAWAKIEIAVECSKPKTPPLRICLSVSADKRSFVLLWSRTIRVRGLCTDGSHNNRHTNSERWIWRTHKHKWSDRCHDRFAYTPTDITATEIQGQFVQFCAECGIACVVTLPELPKMQGDLFDDM